MEITALLLGQLLALATLATGLRVYIHEDHTFRGLHRISNHLHIDAFSKR